VFDGARERANSAVAAVNPRLALSASVSVRSAPVPGEPSRATANASTASRYGTSADGILARMMPILRESPGAPGLRS
jgi:hypothetical protein